MFALKAGVEKEVHWPVILIGVLSTVLLSAGVLRHYYDICIHRTVRGISFIFVAIDAAGDVFSLISVCKYQCHEILAIKLIRTVFQPRLDVLGMVIYATEFVLWCGVFACGGYFNLLPWAKQKLSNRSQIQQESELQEERNQESPHDLTLHQIGSSTSVFRTPSSVVSSRLPTRSAE